MINWPLIFPISLGVAVFIATTWSKLVSVNAALTPKITSNETRCICSPPRQPCFHQNWRDLFKTQILCHSLFPNHWCCPVAPCKGLSPLQDHISASLLPLFRILIDFFNRVPQTQHGLHPCGVSWLICSTPWFTYMHMNTDTHGLTHMHSHIHTLTHADILAYLV